MNDPLSSLVVNRQEVDRTRLAAALKDRIGVDSKSGEVVLLNGFADLGSAKTKVLAYLLGKKAAALLGRVDEEGAGPTAISEELGIPIGTVGRVLRELASDRIAAQDDQRRYLVPSHQLTTAERMLNSES